MEDMEKILTVHSGFAAEYQNKAENLFESSSDDFFNEQSENTCGGCHGCQSGCEKAEYFSEAVDHDLQDAMLDTYGYEYYGDYEDLVNPVENDEDLSSEYTCGHKETDFDPEQIFSNPDPYTMIPDPYSKTRESNIVSDSQS